jgi:hypothetical protein
MDISLPDNWLDAASNLEVKNAVLAAALERDPFPLSLAELVDEFENLSPSQAAAAVRVLESHGLLRVAGDERFAITERGKQYLLARMAQAMMSARHGATNAVVALRHSLGTTHADEVAMFAEKLSRGEGQSVGIPPFAKNAKDGAPGKATKTEHGDPTPTAWRRKQMQRSFDFALRIFAKERFWRRFAQDDKGVGGVVKGPSAAEPILPLRQAQGQDDTTETFSSPTLRQQWAKGWATHTQHSRTLRERALSRLSWMALFGLLMWVYLEILLEAAK